MVKVHNLPLVSIITVSFNAGKTIDRTIRSVLSQTYPKIEYLIIDGLSTDNTLEIVDGYRDIIAAVISEKDDGIYDAMNKGILLAKGKLIGILNADDWYEPNAVSNVVSEWIRKPSVSVVHGLLRFWKEDNLLFTRGQTSRCLSFSMIEHPTCFITRETYDELGLYSTRFRAAADYDLILRLHRARKEFLFIETVIGNFYLGGMTSTKTSLIEEIIIKRTYGLISRYRYYMTYILIQIRFFFLERKKKS